MFIVEYWIRNGDYSCKTLDSFEDVLGFIDNIYCKNLRSVRIVFP